MQNNYLCVVSLMYRNKVIKLTLKLYTMTTLKNELNLNFNTVENTIKTIGLLLIVAASVALIINMIVNPVNFTF